MRTPVASIAAAVAVVAVAFVGTAGRCWACSCVASSDSQNYDQSSVVFTGAAVARREPAATAGPVTSSADPIVWIFKVESAQKGEAASEQEVVTQRDEASCGFTFAVGRRYQVFGDRGEDGRPRTGLCSGTRELAAGESPYARGPSTPPQTMARPQPPPGIVEPGPLPNSPPVDAKAARDIAENRGDPSVMPGLVIALVALAALGVAVGATLRTPRA